MTRLDAAVLAIYYLTLGIVAIYGLHRLHLVRLRRRFAATPPERAAEGSGPPPVTIQLPLYNEPNVAARLIDAVCAIRYGGALDVQMLDDSTDATTDIVAGRVRAWRERGVAVAHIRRGSRDGYKAGALAHGMQLSGAELFAVFDADFVPPPDILERMVPHFAADVGMVQARWTHLNRDESLLTRVQAIFLDAHFAVESAARHLGGRFFNFNGTAGVWRREAIEDAGGWSSSTLTEDLDLSYRAQLAGWRFVFLPEVEVPAELPAQLSGFQEQQHRWAKGSIQTARKLLPRILASDAPRAIKWEAFFHLTNNSAYLLTVIISLLMIPAITIRQRLGATWSLLIDAALFLASTVSVLLFYVEGQRFAGRPRPRLRELMAVLPVGVAISVRNSAAVLEGLFGSGGQFRRTPKRGDALRAISEGPPRMPISELVLAGFFVTAAAGLVLARQWISLPFVFLFLGGYLYAAAQSVRERIAFK